jgi:hypothetical protein
MAVYYEVRALILNAHILISTGSSIDAQSREMDDIEQWGCALGQRDEDDETELCKTIIRNRCNRMLFGILP